MADNITGIYLGTETLSAITLRRTKKSWAPVGGTLHLLTAAEQDVPGIALKAAARAAKHGGGPVMLCLPKLHAIVRKALLPSLDAGELAQMARFEAERHIPLHPERHATGYHILRSMGVEGSEVLLGAIDGPIIDKTLDAAKLAGLRPGGLTLSSVGLVNSLIFARRDWVKGRTIAILSIGLDMLDIVLMAEGRVLMARSVQMDLRGVLEAWVAGKGSGSAASESPDGLRPDVARLALAARMIDCLTPRGAAAATGGEAAPTGATTGAMHLVEGWMDRIVQELRRTYDFARREVRCPPIDALVLTGEGAALRNLDQFLLTSLSAELIVLNPLEKMPETAALKFPFGGLEMTIPFGAAMANEIEGGYRLDLLPAEFHRTQGRRSAARRLAVTGVLAVAAAGLGIAAWMQQADIRQRAYSEYAEAVAKMEPKVKDLNEMKDKLKIIEQFTKDPNSALEVMNSLAAFPAIPTRLTLMTIDFKKGDTVSITGEAREVPDISSYIAGLRDSKHFSDVKSTRQDPHNGFGQTWYQFQLDGPLSQPKGAASAKPKEGRKS